MASKQEQVVQSIRDRIIAGRPGPGGRLSSQLELARCYGVSPVTVQMALKRLERDGFVETRNRSGTFVVRNPPYLDRYGLVFWNDPSVSMGRRSWTSFCRALCLAAMDLERDTGRQVRCFYGVDWHADSADRKRLIEMIESQQLAGVVFANAPHYLKDSPILDLPGMPRVAVEPASDHPNVRAVNTDSSGWMSKALDYLAAAGRRRVAWIGLGDSPAHCARMEAEISTRGLTTHPRWQQVASLHAPEGAANLTRILMADREPPDALLIEDDNFVEQAVSGLAAAGAKVPEDIAVVGHANFPLPPARALPIRLLGYDLSALLRACVEVIDRWRRGEEPPDLTLVPALWEDEVNNSANPRHRRGGVGVRGPGSADTVGDRAAEEPACPRG